MASGAGGSGEFFGHHSCAEASELHGSAIQRAVDDEAVGGGWTRASLPSPPELVIGVALPVDGGYTEQTEPESHLMGALGPVRPGTSHALRAVDP